jgi:hypothetical protein
VTHRRRLVLWGVFSLVRLDAGLLADFVDISPHGRHLVPEGMEPLVFVLEGCNPLLKFSDVTSGTTHSSIIRVG